MIYQKLFKYQNSNNNHLDLSFSTKSRYLDEKLDDSDLEDAKLLVAAHNCGDPFEV